MKEKNSGSYPHIDRPWMKYYDKEKALQQDPNTNLADYVKMKNQGRTDNVAETYYGSEMTYHELFDKVDNASKVLVGIGVNKNDRIMNLDLTFQKQDKYGLVHHKLVQFLIL